MNYLKLRKGKLFLTACLLLICFSCKKDRQSLQNAEELSSKTEKISLTLASQVATTFMQSIQSRSNAQGKQLSVKSSGNASFEKEISSTRVIQEKKGHDLFYIVNFKPSGFAIISATKKHEPILAYSASGNFDYEKAEYGVKDWLAGMSNKIDYLITKDIKPDSLSLASWKVYAPAKEITTNDAPDPDHEITVPGPTVYKNYGPLLKTLWSQGDGYNDGIPSSYGCASNMNGKPPIGCVATAMGQIMNFWKFPSNFDWNNMSNQSGYGAIPGLLYNVATAVNMNFACSGSGSNMTNATNAFRNFGFKNVQLNSYNEVQIIYDLESNKPVMLGGSDPNQTAGHAWVCDGYQQTIYEWIHNPNTPYQNIDHVYSTAMFHMNWGWGSEYYNGYYASYNFNSAAGNWNQNVQMITSLYPIY